MRVITRGWAQITQNPEFLAQKMSSVLSTKNEQNFVTSARFTLCEDNVIHLFSYVSIYVYMRIYVNMYIYVHMHVLT